jgi:hypothetical protein
MARAEQVKLYRSFVKGLITEASYLTYPEDSSTDELNTVLSRKGNRSRRYGIDYEDDYTLLPIVLEASDAVTEFVWKAVNNDSSINFLVCQIGKTLRFLSLDSVPVSDNLKSFTVDLSTYSAPTSSELQVRTTNCEFASGKGFLFVVNAHCEPIVIEYNASTDSISVTPIIVLVRDFEGLNDGLANDEEPATLSKEHQYNLMNQGWVSPGFYIVPGGVTIDNPPVYYDPWSGSGYTYNPGEAIP